MVTVLRRVREPRQKSDESLRADVNQMSRTIPIDCSLAQWSVISLLSPIWPSGQYTERVLLRSKPRSRKTSSAAAPVGQPACRPRATARNAVRDWNSVPVLLEGKAGG